MTFKASYDTPVKVITGAILVLFTGLSVFIFRQAMLQDNLALIAIIFLLVLVVAISYLYSISGYEIENKTLKINRPFSSKEVKFEDIISIQAIPADRMNRLVRVFGVGGLFGHFGQYKSATMGYFNLYGTQEANYILIETKAPERLVITPDDMAILARLQQGVNQRS